jgi:hypothetical protein
MRPLAVLMRKSTLLAVPARPNEETSCAARSPHDNKGRDVVPKVNSEDELASSGRETSAPSRLMMPLAALCIFIFIFYFFIIDKLFTLILNK